MSQIYGGHLVRDDDDDVICWLLFPCFQVVMRIQEPGFLCRRHTITHVRDHPIQKIDTIYSRPIMESEKEASRNYTLWTWARQDTERNFSIFDARKGVFHLPEKSAPGGRVYAMAATGEVDKRIWIATAVSKNHPVRAQFDKCTFAISQVPFPCSSSQSFSLASWLTCAVVVQDKIHLLLFDMCML